MNNKFIKFVIKIKMGIKLRFNGSRYNKVLVSGSYCYRRFILIDELEPLDLDLLDLEVDNFRRSIFGEGGLGKYYLYIGECIRHRGKVYNKVEVEVYVFRDYDSMCIFDLVNECLTNKN